MTKYQIEQLTRVAGQIVLDVVIMGLIVYAFHFVFYYPKLWLTAIIVFSVLLRTGWWERIEEFVQRNSNSPRV